MEMGSFYADLLGLLAQGGLYANASNKHKGTLVDVYLAEAKIKVI